MISAWLAAFIEPLSGVPILLPHSGLFHGNITESNRATGPIDWHEARVGRPTYEVARIQFCLIGQVSLSELPSVTNVNSADDDLKHLFLPAERNRLQLREMFKLPIAPLSTADRMSLARKRGGTIKVIMAGEHT